MTWACGVTYTGSSRGARRIAVLSAVRATRGGQASAAVSLLALHPQQPPDFVSSHLVPGQSRPGLSASSMLRLDTVLHAQAALSHVAAGKLAAALRSDWWHPVGVAADEDIPWRVEAAGKSDRCLLWQPKRPAIAWSPDEGEA